MPYLIKNAYTSDIPLIQELAARIWPPTYGDILSKEQIDYMMAWLYNEKMLADQMKGGFEFVLVYSDNEPVGFAATSMITPELHKLHKLYLLHSGHRKGLGRFVVEEIIQRVKAKGATILHLNVNRHNKAKGFYEKIGFTVVSEEDIDIGNGYYMNDYVMGISF